MSHFSFLVQKKIRYLRNKVQEDGKQVKKGKNDGKNDSGGARATNPINPN